MKLIFGVVDVRYSDARGVFKNKADTTPSQATTGDVAGWLETQFHPMGIFYQTRQGKIKQWMAEGISNAIQDIANGAPINKDPLFGAMQKIENEFRQFLDQDEMSGYYPNNFEDAKAGRTKRTKSGYTKNRQPRPALIDTGLYQAAFRSWTDVFSYITRTTKGMGPSI